MAGFEITQEAPHRWRVRRCDGMVEGIFVNRQAALTFARRESLQPLPTVRR